MVAGPEGQGQASVSAGLPQPGDQRWSGGQQDAWAPHWEVIGADLFALAVECEGDGGLGSPPGGHLLKPPPCWLHPLQSLVAWSRHDPA